MYFETEDTNGRVKNISISVSHQKIPQWKYQKLIPTVKERYICIVRQSMRSLQCTNFVCVSFTHTSVKALRMTINLEVEL